MCTITVAVLNIVLVHIPGVVCPHAGKKKVYFCCTDLRVYTSVMADEVHV